MGNRIFGFATSQWVESVIYLYKEYGYELDKVTKDGGVIEEYIQRKNKDYSRLLVIKHDFERNMDIPYVLKFFDSITYTPKKKTRKK